MRRRELPNAIWWKKPLNSLNTIWGKIRQENSNMERRDDPLDLPDEDIELGAELDADDDDDTTDIRLAVVGLVFVVAGILFLLVPCIITDDPTLQSTGYLISGGLMFALGLVCIVLNIAWCRRSSIILDELRERRAERLQLQLKTTTTCVEEVEERQQGRFVGIVSARGETAKKRTNSSSLHCLSRPIQNEFDGRFGMQPFWSTCWLTLDYSLMVMQRHHSDNTLSSRPMYYIWWRLYYVHSECIFLLYSCLCMFAFAYFSFPKMLTGATNRHALLRCPATRGNYISTDEENRIESRRLPLTGAIVVHARAHFRRENFPALPCANLRVDTSSRLPSYADTVVRFMTSAEVHTHAHATVCPNTYLNPTYVRDTAV